MAQPLHFWYFPPFLATFFDVLSCNKQIYITSSFSTPGACGRDCNSQFNLNHLFNDAHLHPISLITCGTKDLAHQPFMPDCCFSMTGPVFMLISSPAPVCLRLPHIWLTSLGFHFFLVSQQFMCNCVHKHADATSPQVLLVVANRPVMYAILPFYLFC